MGEMRYKLERLRHVNPLIAEHLDLAKDFDYETVLEMLVTEMYSEVEAYKQIAKEAVKNAPEKENGKAEDKKKDQEDHKETSNGAGRKHRKIQFRKREHRKIVRSYKEKEPVGEMG